MGGAAIPTTLFVGALITKSVQTATGLQSIAAKGAEERRASNAQIEELRRQARIRSDERTMDLQLVQGDIMASAGAAGFSGESVEALRRSMAAGAGLEDLRDRAATARNIDEIRHSLSTLDERMRAERIGVWLDISGNLFEKGVKVAESVSVQQAKSPGTTGRVTGAKRGRF
jgi:hypothetical protein